MYGSFAMDGYERAFRVSNEPDRSASYSHAHEERMQRTVVTRVVNTDENYHELAPPDIPWQVSTANREG